MDSHVLAIPDALFQRFAGPVIPPAELSARDLLKDVATTETAVFMHRRRAEVDDTHRQVIPYVILCHGGLVLSYRRTFAGSEARLSGLLSIGWGGHVDLSDAQLNGQRLDVAQTLDVAVRRELWEELRLSPPEERQYRGLILDRESTVGRVHVAIVQSWSFGDKPQVTCDRYSERLAWVRPEDVSGQQKLESWSAYALGLLQYK